MPTWREWIADEDERLFKYEGTTNIAKTNYFVKWTSFITDPRLKALANRYNCRFIFFPHRNMQKYIDFLPDSTDYIEIADAKDYDVQELMKRASMMITDYSSVFFDMVYMKKPIVFYQFDYDTFREAQYDKGYFQYGNNPFGKSYKKKEQVFDEIEIIIKRGFAINDKYLTAHSEYFELFDKDNCKRVFDIVRAL